jgi:hypothetical protein|tara:strand:+ start:352 stop:516 length:165 start_codon:yes stop_codon:yes gene_type:complete
MEMNMEDKEMMELISKLAELPEYRRKEIAILLMSTTLNYEAVEYLAGYMVRVSG